MPVREAVGPWNFGEINPHQALGRFNGFYKNVILRISEARDLGDVNRYQFYDHMKTYTASPPDVIRVDEKHIQEHSILNCVGIIITTNYKTNGIFLPAEDRRHYVAWSERVPSDFPDGYWNKLFGWYGAGGIRHVVALLEEYNLAGVDPKEPPPKTQAFWDIVDANRAPQDAELADLLDKLGNPPALTLRDITANAGDKLREWLEDPKNQRMVPVRMGQCEYSPVRNENRKDGFWMVDGNIYALKSLSYRERMAAAQERAGGRDVVKFVVP